MNVPHSANATTGSVKSATAGLVGYRGETAHDDELRKRSALISSPLLLLIVMTGLCPAPYCL